MINNIQPNSPASILNNKVKDINRLIYTDKHRIRVSSKELSKHQLRRQEFIKALKLLGYEVKEDETK